MTCSSVTQSYHNHHCNAARQATFVLTPLLAIGSISMWLSIQKVCAQCAGPLMQDILTLALKVTPNNVQGNLWEMQQAS